jgi:hypothetical protein
MRAIFAARAAAGAGTPSPRGYAASQNCRRNSAAAVAHVASWRANASGSASARRWSVGGKGEGGGEGEEQPRTVARGAFVPRADGLCQCGKRILGRFAGEPELREPGGPAFSRADDACPRGRYVDVLHTTQPSEIP